MSSRTQKAPGKARLAVLIIIITLIWVVIIGRLAEIQLVYGSEYHDIARKQSTGKIEVKPDRGMIYDRKGRQIAINVIRNALYAYPSNTGEIRYIKRYLNKLYDRSSNSLETSKLKPLRFRWLDRKLSDDYASKILADSVPGLYIKNELGREYPFGKIGKQLIGLTDIDGNGIAGIEYSYDSVLAGTPGLIDYLRDARSKTYRINEIPLIEPEPGNSMVLTIDWRFQEIVEEELRKAVDKYKAIEGIALFMDCHTGEILAAADCRSDGSDGSIKLRAVSDVYEPGSVFKVFTAAALLQEEAVDTTELIYCEHGLWKCGRKWLRDDEELDSLDFRHIFELSSNIGIGKLAIRLGNEKLVETIKKFGFGQKTYVGLPGEQAGMIGDPGVWSDYNMAALAMGHSISATPLQLVTGVSSVANGGELMQPTIIKGIISADGDILKKNRPKKIGRVIKSKNAAVLRSFMAGVVSEGTATLARSDIVSIAGKTGTAEAVDFENGGYKKNKFVASFLGFFPVENPKVAGIVVLHQPEPVHYGGRTSGPAFKNMAERYCIAYADDFRPDTKLLAGEDNLELKEVPDFIGQDISFAKEVAARKGFKLSANADTGIVIWQYPPEGRKLAGEEIVALLVESQPEEKMTMLDLRGMRIRTAAAVLDRLGMKFKIEGSGRIKRHYPRPGKDVHENMVCKLVGQNL